MSLNETTMTTEQMTATTERPQAPATVESVVYYANNLLAQERWGDACNAYELASYMAQDRSDGASYHILSSMAAVCRRVAFARMGRGLK